MRKILFSGFILLLFPFVIISAQEPLISKGQLDMRKEAERVRSEIEKRQQEELERLKAADPQIYKVTKDALDRQVNINKIISSFREEKISSSEAESRLLPLVKQDMQSRIGNLGVEIARLEKKLEFLKKAKTNPDLLIKNRISQLLGKTVPTSEDFLF